MGSIRKNFFYSSILTTANYVFPFLTYPYVSRVLGVTNIGVCNFVDGIINYFILFSMMGISATGIREIARCRDVAQRSRVFSSLLVLNTVSTTIMLVALVIAIYAVPKLYEYRALMYIGALKLVCNYLLVEWLYKGLEDFKFITVRTICVKLAYVVAVFVFVRDADDYVVYYFLLSMMVVVNAAISIAYSRRLVAFTLRGLSVRPYIKPFMVLGGYMLLTSMYTTFNVVYLGFCSGETEVGYYATATKLYSILLALFTAFTTVLLPRMSHLIGEGRTDEFKSLFGKSVQALFAFSLPLIAYSTIMAPQIVSVISGSGYEGAVLPMRIVMPLMLVIGYEQILIMQILMPLKNDRAILVNSVIGAAVALCLNVLLVARWHSVGSAVVWVASELAVLCSAQLFVSRHMGFGFPVSGLLRNVVLNLPLAFAIYLVYAFVPGNDVVQLLVAGIVMVLYSFVLQYFVLRNEFVVSLVNKFIRRGQR